MSKTKIVLLSVLATAGICIAGQVYAIQFMVSGQEVAGSTPTEVTAPIVDKGDAKVTVATVVPTATISTQPLSLEDRVKKLEARVSELEAKK